MQGKPKTMQLLKNLKIAFFYFKLKKATKNQIARNQSKSFDKAKSVAIVFNSKDLETEKSILLFAEALREKAKKVYLLAFVDKDLENAKPYSVVSTKDLDWWGRPKKDSVGFTWIQKEFDCIISLCTEPKPVMDYVVSKGKAILKIGLNSKHPWLFDVMLENAGRDMKKNLQYLNKVLQTIKSSSYEPAI